MQQQCCKSDSPASLVPSHNPEELADTFQYLEINCLSSFLTLEKFKEFNTLKEGL